MSAPRASVILPNHNEGELLLDTVDAVLEASGEGGLDGAFEVIVVDDGSDDGSGDHAEARFDGAPVRVLRGSGLGVVGARNLGADHARGDVVVFLDAHCHVRPGWLAALVAALDDRPEAGMVGPAVGSLRHHPLLLGYGVSFVDASLATRWLTRRADEPYAVPLLCGCCQALRREDFLAVGRYDPGMPRWGSEDLELGLRLYLLGREVLVVPDSVIHHLFRDRHPYRVSHALILHNLLRMAVLHLSRPRVERVAARHRRHRGFERGWRKLLAGDAWRTRRRLVATRRRDDDWYCHRFGLAI